MDSCLEKEDRIIQIRDKLRKDKIKLWMPPYFNESLPCETALKNLAEDYSGQLKIPFEICYDTVKELQNNSLENLKQKNLFQESGLASLKIKILHQNSPPMIISKEILLSTRTIDLKGLIKQDIHFEASQFKLISCGRILNDPDSLASQGVKNGQQIMALILSEKPSDIIASENQMKELETVKSDSRLLALDNEYMQLEDQFGNTIHIPPNEKQALIVAMALHERGKSALKKNEYSIALVFFLEADQEFRQCNSELLKTVDNYALLDLDIAWCYLCLESLVNLPEAYERLKRCEQKFHTTYGPNLERLIAVKGTGASEEALFMRLHLMQAIVLYHQNKRSEALSLLKKVEDEMKRLKVDENNLVALTELGYSVPEATLGLRATGGDVNHAADYINQNRERRAEARRKAEAEAILEKEKRKLGLCADGEQYVEPNFVKYLVRMGYNKEAARIALQKTNNVISDSVQYIQDNPLPGPSKSKSSELLSLIEDYAKELSNAGFDIRMAKLALEKHSGDIMAAAEELIANDGIVLGDLSKIVGSESIENIKKKRLENKEKKAENEENSQQNEEKNEAFNRLREDIETIDDDHLDIDLLQEERFLKRYLSLLEK